MRESVNDPVAQRIAEIKRQLADLEARLPAHSVPPAMVIKMEALEDELEQLQRGLEKRDE